MDALPVEVLGQEILPHGREYAPALRAVCRAWRAAAVRLPGRATKGRGLTFLAKQGHIALILWTKAGRDKEFQTAQLNNMLEGAAARGHTPLVRSLVDWGARRWEAALIQAARHGHVSTLFLLKRQWRTYSLLDQVIDAAARGGHLGLVVLLGQWWSEAFPNVAINVDNILARAARGGHLEIVRLAHTWGGEGSAKALTGAARGGHIEIITYLWDNIYLRNRMTHALQQALGGAARGGHVKVIELLWELGAPTEWPLLQAAALREHTKLIMYLKARGATDYLSMQTGAARRGSMALCRQAREWGAWLVSDNGVVINDVLREAALSGNTELLKLLREWLSADLKASPRRAETLSTCINAAFAGAIYWGKCEAAILLRSWGGRAGSDDYREFLDAAIDCGDFELLRLLVHWLCEDDNNEAGETYAAAIICDAFREAARAGEIRAMHLLRDLGIEGLLEAEKIKEELNGAMVSATLGNQPEVMRLLRGWGASYIDEPEFQLVLAPEVRALLREWRGAAPDGPDAPDAPDAADRQRAADHALAEEAAAELLESFIV